MIRLPRFLALLLGSALALVGCPASPPVVDDDGGLSDGGLSDGGLSDGGPSDGGENDTDGGDDDEDAGPPDRGIENPWGFTMRTPGTHRLPCEDLEFSCTSEHFEAFDKDYVCTLSIDGHDAVVYVRATPTAVNTGGFPFPVYDEVKGFVAEDGSIVEVPAAYDYGGNHHNDLLTITLGGVRYTWDHSSYGYGFRACAPPDCLKREEGDAYTDGCQPERTLPEACIAVADPLPELVDTFETCPGDES